MQNVPNKLDCFVKVITPENIEFEYALAGPFQRLLAFVFDFVLRVVVFVGVLFVLALTTSWIPLGQIVVTIVGLLSFFALSWFYGIFFETRFNGKTLGKMVFRLRVISVDGRPINGVQAALRNLLRLADMGFPVSIQIFDPEAPPAYIIPTMLVGLTCMLLTRRSQRIGDLAAGTIVVSEQRRSSPWNLQPEDARAFGLAELIPANYQVSSSLAQTIGLYMENRKRLSPLRRHEVARHLADPLIRRFDLLQDTSPDLLLCALYVRIYLSDEQREQGRNRMRQTLGPMTPPPLPTSFANAMGNRNMAAASAGSPLGALNPMTSQPVAQGSQPTDLAATVVDTTQVSGAESIDIAGDVSPISRSDDVPPSGDGARPAVPPDEEQAT